MAAALRRAWSSGLSHSPRLRSSLSAANLHATIFPGTKNDPSPISREGFASTYGLFLQQPAEFLTATLKKAAVRVNGLLTVDHLVGNDSISSVAASPTWILQQSTQFSTAHLKRLAKNRVKGLFAVDQLKQTLKDDSLSCNASSQWVFPQSAQFSTATLEKVAKDRVRGMLTVEELKLLVKGGTIDTVVVGLTDCYGRLVGKRYSGHFFLESAVSDGTHGCSYLLATDMDMEPVPGYKFASWEQGYGDIHLVPDLNTLRVASWLDKTAFVLCDVVDDETHDLAPHAPRSVLKKQVAEASKLGGLTPMGASELEYFLYQQNFEEAKEKSYFGLKPVGWHREDYHILQGSREEFFNGPARRHLDASGVPVENSKGEFGLGQHELNVKYAEVLEMADRHVVYKQCLKELADQLGVSVTFMAKPQEDQPGSSSHLHISLWKDGKNMFDGDKKLGTMACSDEFRWFLGGFMKHTPELMVFYAPNVNSYKRFIAGSWAPTQLVWSRDNRTAPFRLIGSGNSLRIECRLPGADCNPYLAFAAAVASGLDGIRHKIEPPMGFEGDVYKAKNLLQVPRSLADALLLFQKSSFAKKMLGDDVHHHYAHFFETENIAYMRAVTDWEKNRYFEQI